MKQNKTKKEVKETLYRSMDRVFLLTFPVGISFLILTLFGQIPPLSALIGFVLTFFFTFLLAGPFLRELEQLINYLKQEAEGRVNIQMPRFAKRRREAFKIVQSFNQIKMNWLNRTKILEAQTLSDTAILESLPEPLLMLNKNGDIVSANLSARQLLGKKISLKSVFEIFKNDGFAKAIKCVMENQSEHENIEFQIKLNGKKVYLRALINWLPAMTKNKAEVVVLLHDITNFKVFEKSQNAFFANASHELKTPLSVLSGFIETLQTSAKDDAEAREKFLNIMAEQTTHMTDLVQDLLALSRLDLENDAEPENILIPDLIRSVFQALQLKAQKQNKKLLLKENATLPPFKCYSSELFRVFQNLVDNALKYGKNKSTVTVTLDTQMENVTQSDGTTDIPTQMLVVSVHNLGSVIPQEEIPHLFERFYRMEQNMNVSGTGLGLAIASEIVHKYQGTITVESKPRTGTTFIVRLPRAL
ncbi:MAG: PAS domain-containing protein [Alphaproteobacteria bacterium]|nr:PAS domain-containing protein [Alphaproteobacteria bacterium]